MARLINKKLPAATLIETLIAMAIIMVVFSIAMKVFGNVMQSGVSYHKIQVQNQLNLLVKKVQAEGYSNEDHMLLDGVDYHFMTDTSALPGLSKLSIKASQGGKVMGIVKCLFKVKEQGVED